MVHAKTAKKDAEIAKDWITNHFFALFAKPLRTLREIFIVIYKSALPDEK